MIRLLVLLTLASCAPDAASRSVPNSLQTCAGPVYAPQPPPIPRTIQSVLAWSGRLNVAQQQTERARSDCSGKLHKLNLWVEGEQL